MLSFMKLQRPAAYDYYMMADNDVNITLGNLEALCEQSHQLLICITAAERVLSASSAFRASSTRWTCGRTTSWCTSGRTCHGERSRLQLLFSLWVL